jgi:hypothetical protein
MLDLSQNEQKYINIYYIPKHTAMRHNKYTLQNKNFSTQLKYPLNNLTPTTGRQGLKGEENKIHWIK